MQPGKHTVLHRTHCEKLLSNLAKRHLSCEVKRKIKGNFILIEGKKAILEVMTGCHCVCVSGVEPQQAKNQAATKETLMRQLMKTGGTPFEFEQLDVSLEDGLFYPIQNLNEIRREALRKLEDEILSGFFRKISIGAKEEKDSLIEEKSVPLDKTAAEKLNIHASVEEWEQFEALLDEPWIESVYLDYSLFYPQRSRQKNARTLSQAADLLHRQNRKCILMLPQIWRTEVQESFNRYLPISQLDQIDGLLLRSSEQILFCRPFAEKKTLIADASVYTFNQSAREFWKQQQIRTDTIPLELNRQELRERGCCGSECIVYGYLPLMQTAQCVVKNTTGCRQEAGIQYLKDRKNAQFPVKNQCDICLNVIYNSAPLDLISCLEEVVTLQPQSLRLMFTIESGNETAELIRMAKERIYQEKKEAFQVSGGTRGHFRRGVE